MFDLLVLGSGIAGLSGAVHASRAGWSVLVLTKGELAHSATRYAQGGVAAAFEDGADDSPELHFSDTIAAGAGLCDPDAVRVLVTEGPDRVRELITMGAVFDQTGDGEVVVAVAAVVGKARLIDNVTMQIAGTEVVIDLGVITVAEQEIIS